MKKYLTTICIMIIMLTMIPMACADEKYGEYEIYSSGMEDIIMYSVYTPEQIQTYSEEVRHHAIAPTFVTDSTDVYVGADSGSDIRITFYRGMEIEERDQAEAFAGYVAGKSRAQHCYAGWFSLEHGTGTSRYTAYCVFIIEGWDESMPLEDLTRDLFYNNTDTSLQFYELGHGDIINEKWDWIRNEMHCNMAVWFQVKQPRDGMTTGMTFTDRESGFLYPYA